MSRNSAKKIYLAFYKPYGVLSQFTIENEGDQTLKDYFPQLSKNVYPVGRLDKDSEGLLFLTNDNAFKNKLLSPSSDCPKTYWAQVEGSVSEEALAQLEKGVKIRVNKKDHVTKPAQANEIFPTHLAERTPPIRKRKNIPTSWIQLTISEGKNRQVRRMCAAVGFPVLRLIRVQIGNYRLPEHHPGKWVSLQPSQVW